MTGHKNQIGSVSLAQEAPELAKSWDYERNGLLTPDKVTPGSGKKVWWKCQKCGESWQASPSVVVGNSRKSKSQDANGCPYCAGKRVSKVNSLGVNHPSLIAEWDTDKNKGLTTFDVTPGSNRKAWWVCPKGHSYVSTPKQRNARVARGCPVCAGKVVIPETSLAAHFPDVSRQWHPTKNGKLTPLDVTPGSNRKTWWRCQQDHEWQTAIYARTIQGSGCPICAGVSTSLLEMRLYCELKKILPDTLWRTKSKGFEIDILIPSLNIGIEADGSYWHRDKLKADLHKTERAEQNGVTLIHLRETPLKRLTDFDIEYARNEDDLKLVHALLDRIKRLSGLPELNEVIDAYILSGKLHAEAEYRKLAANLPAPPFENSLASTNPEIAAEWNYEKNAPLAPEMFMARSDRKVWWRCSAKGHEYLSRLADRAVGCGCPYCDGKKVAPENSLAALFPDIASSWDMERNAGLTPQDVTKRSHKKYWWWCKNCGESWEASVASRTGGRGCPYCSGTRAGKSNSLASLWPDMAATWAYDLNGELTPSDVTPGSSSQKVWWRCPFCVHTWQALVKSRLQNPENIGCRKCNLSRKPSNDSAA